MLASRCRVHNAGNLIAHVPRSHAEMVAAVFRTVFAQPDPEAVSRAWEEIRDQRAASFAKVGPLMDEAKAEVLAFTTFPKAHWRKIWSTNPLELQQRLHSRLFPGEELAVVDRDLAVIASADPRAARLMTIPGVDAIAGIDRGRGRRLRPLRRP